ncbi:alpha/beta fold hydrolase [Pseudorhodobacter antarcticus]|jgi:pimeloyl-ACP methyl ester carboxylesterase|nr:alpha/beta fold hydrolase [Pseudorhodobacter antarcticus]
MLNSVFYPAQSPVGLPPLLIVHGLFGSARNWGVIARRMAADRDVVAVDMRNHGDSFWADSHTYADMATDLAAVIAAHGGRMDVMGHSMGGKAAMQLALTHGDLVDRLIVADIAPVAYDHDQSPHVRAMQGLDLAGITTRGAADSRLAGVMEDPGLRAFFLQSLDLKADPVRWRLNLDVLAEQMPAIVGWPGTKGVFDGPVLFLAGAGSHYVKPEYRADMRALFPAARFAKIPGAGHWLHAEKPREFEDTLRVFLTR